jgi:uncharacterized small protein (DUF1192 family)
MDTDDLEPKKKPKSYELGQDLSKLSVGELKALIEDLKAEIARVEAMHAAKQSSKSAAEAASSVNDTVPLGKPALRINSILGLSR